VREYAFRGRRQHRFPAEPKAHTRCALAPVCTIAGSSFLFFCSWPFEVLPPTARIGFASSARIILNTMQLRRVDTGKAENLSPSFNCAPSRVIKCSKCDCSAAAQRFPAPTASIPAAFF
jgi:hypothetical protein